MQTFWRVTAVALFLLLCASPLWAGSPTRTVAVSCIVKPRLNVQMEQEEQKNKNAQLHPGPSYAQGGLLVKQERRSQGLPSPYQQAIVYTYCPR